MCVDNNSSYQFPLEDVVSIFDFSRTDIEYVLQHAKEITALSVNERMKLLNGKVIALLFFEPSTRTKLSFASGIHKMGGQVIGFDDVSNTSLSKGESFTDTLKMVEKYADLVIMRHPKDGSARLAADTIIRPLINAGDGRNQHPTQTLLDLYTIEEQFGKIDGLKIGMCGDNKHYRNFHSLALALSKFDNVTVYLISPDSLKVSSTIKNAIQSKVTIVESDDLKSVLPELDVLYMGRIPKEYFENLAEYNQVKNIFQINKETLQTAQKHLKVMHPLPRLEEIARDVDDTPHALYFTQANNAIPVRQALLDLLIRKEKQRNGTDLISLPGLHCLNKTCISNSENILPKVLLSKSTKNKYCHYCGKKVD
jgi:aspartate carbamoyltransferase catalytic subunit